MPDVETPILTCPISGDTRIEPLCSQDGYDWVMFPVSGYARLRQMPSLAEADEIQSSAVGESYIHGYEQKWASKKRRSKNRARFLKRQMTGRRLLDVGSNVGLFVKAAHDLGLNAEGVELNSALVDYAKNKFPELTFHCAGLEKFLPSEDKFDGIYCSEVIEHVVDPTEFARLLRDLLNSQGVLYLTTPALEQYMKNGNVVKHMGAPDHKLYFNRSNIVGFLENVGFTDIRHKFSLDRGRLQVIAKNP